MASVIYAHRGASGYAPENTLESFKLAMEMGADGFELDVHVSRDGELIVIHDETVDRTTNGTGRIMDMTLQQIKALDASNHGSADQLRTENGCDPVSGYRKKVSGSGPPHGSRGAAAVLLL